VRARRTAAGGVQLGVPTEHIRQCDRVFGVDGCARVAGLDVVVRRAAGMPVSDRSCGGKAGAHLVQDPLAMFVGVDEWLLDVVVVVEVILVVVVLVLVVVVLPEGPARHRFCPCCKSQLASIRQNGQYDRDACSGNVPSQGFSACKVASEIAFAVSILLQ
jgi:hypothetical protein